MTRNITIAAVLLIILFVGVAQAERLYPNAVEYCESYFLVSNVPTDAGEQIVDVAVYLQDYVLRNEFEYEEADSSIYKMIEEYFLMVFNQQPPVVTSVRRYYGAVEFSYSMGIGTITVFLWEAPPFNGVFLKEGVAGAQINFCSLVFKCESSKPRHLMIE